MSWVQSNLELPYQALELYCQPCEFLAGGGSVLGLGRSFRGHGLMVVILRLISSATALCSSAALAIWVFISLMLPRLR